MRAVLPHPAASRAGVVTPSPEGPQEPRLLPGPTRTPRLPARPPGPQGRQASCLSGVWEEHSILFPCGPGARGQRPLVRPVESVAPSASAAVRGVTLCVMVISKVAARLVLSFVRSLCFEVGRQAKCLSL